MPIKFFRNNENAASGGFAIAADPFEASYECEGLLGIRLQEKASEDVEITEEASYPGDHLVFGRYLSELYNTFMYPLEEEQIRSTDDLNRTVVLSATITRDDVGSSGFKRLLLELPRAEHPVNAALIKEYTIPVEDFATPAIDEQRKRSGHAKMKNTLIKHAGSVFEQFLDS